MKTLIFIPTYNERDNVRPMLEELRAQDLDADVLFMDDASPDGTGAILDELARKHAAVRVAHRPGKLGIGSAHLEGIQWAYARGYARLVTMDGDFTHSPADIPRLLEQAAGNTVVLASRYMEPGSLPGWNPLRRCLTWLGHGLTRGLLRLPYDATGAFRVYDLQKLPPHIFAAVRSKGYAFFFESLLLVVRNGYSVAEVPIVLPARTYGSSKMSLAEAMRSARRVLGLWAAEMVDRQRFRLAEPFTPPDPGSPGQQEWDGYWERKHGTVLVIYEIFAALYRKTVIRRRLNRAVRRHFPAGSRLLHAGCGGGQVDLELQHDMAITAVDISPRALALYARNAPRARAVAQADIRRLPFEAGVFDGAYNLGVMEHFPAAEVRAILRELSRVLRIGGKVVIFWPHAHGSSVRVLDATHWLLRRVLRREVQLHPPEICRLTSLAAVEPWFRDAGLRLVEYQFGIQDLFVQAVLVAEKV
jgi:dolichol-phosphate mannosyltransferase